MKRPSIPFSLFILLDMPNKTKKKQPCRTCNQESKKMFNDEIFQSRVKVSDYRVIHKHLPELKDGKYKDMKIVVSGFRDKDIISYIENEGGILTNTVSKNMPIFKIKLALACKIQYLNVLNNVLKFVSNSQYIVFTRHQFIKLKISLSTSEYLDKVLFNLILIIKLK